MTALTGAAWRKSTRSDNEGECVEVADNLAGVVAVRDTKDRPGPALVFNPASWQRFLRTVKPRGE